MKMQYYMYNSKFNQYAVNALINKYGIIDNMQNELFIQVIWNNILVPNYLISNMGRVYNLNREEYLKISNDKDGYEMITINVNGIKKKVRLHRLMMQSFYPIDNYEEMVVNHKDGNVANNIISNLEWTTCIENTRHAWKIGLNTNIGENHPLSIYSDDEIHKICSLIDKGYTNAQIADVFKKIEFKERVRFSALISGIRNGKAHLPISTQYNFMNGSTGKINYSLDFAYLVCLFLSDDNTYTFKELADLLRIPHEERNFFVKFVCDIINGDTALEVSRQFNHLERPLAYRTNTDYYY